MGHISVPRIGSESASSRCPGRTPSCARRARLALACLPKQAPFPSVNPACTLRSRWLCPAHTARSKHSFASRTGLAVPPAAPPMPSPCFSRDPAVRAGPLRHRRCCMPPGGRHSRQSGQATQRGASRVLKRAWHACNAAELLCARRTWQYRHSEQCSGTWRRGVVTDRGVEPAGGRLGAPAAPHCRTRPR